MKKLSTNLSFSLTPSKVSILFWAPNSCMHLASELVLFILNYKLKFACVLDFTVLLKTKGSSFNGFHTSVCLGILHPKFGELRAENLNNWGNCGDSLGRPLLALYWRWVCSGFLCFFFRWFYFEFGTQNSSYAKVFSLQGVGCLLLTWAS